MATRSLEKRVVYSNKSMAVPTLSWNTMTQTMLLGGPPRKMRFTVRTASPRSEWTRLPPRQIGSSVTTVGSAYKSPRCGTHVCPRNAIQPPTDAGNHKSERRWSGLDSRDKEEMCAVKPTGMAWGGARMRWDDVRLETVRDRPTVLGFIGECAKLDNPRVRSSIPRSSRSFHEGYTPCEHEHGRKERESEHSDCRRREHRP